MALPFCPHTGSEEWKQLVSRVGEKTAYWFFARYEGDFNAIYSALSQTGVRLQPTLNRPEISLKSVSTGRSRELLEDKSLPKVNLSTHPINELNNQAIWDVENELGLVSIRTIGGVKYKFYNAVSLNEARKLQDWILQNHLDVKVKFVSAWTGASNEVGIKLEGYPKNVDKTIAEHKTMLANQVSIEREEIERETREDLLPDPIVQNIPTDNVNRAEELASIKKVTDQLDWAKQPATKLLDLLEPQDVRQKQAYELVKQNIEKFPNLQVEVILREYAPERFKNSPAYYSPNTDSIVLIDENIHAEANASYNFFNHAMLHEFIHAFTKKGLQEDKNFRSKMEKIFELAKKHSTNDKLYGYTKVEEFVSEIMTNQELVDDIKPLKYNLWQRFLKLIGDFLGINLVKEIDETAIDAILAYVPKQESFATIGEPMGMAPKDRHDLFRISDNIDLNNREEAEKLLRSIKDDYIVEKGKPTRHRESKWPMLGVRNVMSQFGLGINKKKLEANQTLQEAVDRGGAIGTVIHGVIHNIRGGRLDIKNDLGFVSSTGLRNDLIEILRNFEGEEVTIIPELYIASPFKGLHGYIDLVVIDKNNKVHLYDFKAKEKGFDDWTYRADNTYDQSLNYSDRQLAHAQLTIYKKMFEEVTGLPVASINAVMLEPTIEGNQITGVKLSDKAQKLRSTNPRGIDYFNVSSKDGERIWKLVKHLGARQDKADEFMSQIPAVEDPGISYDVETKLEELRYQALRLPETDVALNKLLKELDKRLEFVKRRGTQSQIEALQSKIGEVRRQEDSLASIKILTEFAIEQTGVITQTFSNLKKEGKEPTIGQLFNWRNNVLAFQGFSEYLQYLSTEVPALNISEENKKLIESLELIMKRVNMIEKWYKSQGIKKLVKFLAPFYNRIRAEAKAKLIKTYRSNPTKRQGLTEKEFVRKGLKAEKEFITSKTELLLENELKKASVDINTLGLWLDNMLDSKDPVAAAMVKAFARTEDISHKASIEKRDNLLKILREFEKKIGDRAGTVSYTKLYDFMLEKEDGKYTGYFIRDKFKSTLWEERDGKKLIGGYMKVVEDTRELPEEERERIRKEWKDEITDFDNTSFQNARNYFINEIYKDKDRGYELTSLDLDTLRQHDVEVREIYRQRAMGQTSRKPPTLQDLANRGGIPHKLADAIDKWVYENAWNYRHLKPQYREKYESKQWKQLMKHKEANDVEWQLYTAVMDMMKEANSMLPFASRISARLPGVEKRTAEMIKDNMGIVATVRETLKKDFTVRVDDPERDNFTREGDEREFLPIHYTGRVDKELQSFDIPTIVFKFWQSANDFNNKIQILPEMELAKYLIKTRDTDAINARRWKLNRRSKSREELVANKNNLAKMVEEWFAMAVYGQPKKNQGKLLGFDTAKLVDAINKYTSINLLGLNFIQGTANALLGETLQLTEQIAGEYMSKSAYRKGTAFYMANFAGIMGDVGNRGAKNIVTKILEEADILDEWEGTNFSKRQKFRHAMSTDTLFFTTHAGEHEMQGRFYLSMLADKRAYDKDGNDLGSMLEQYYVDKETSELKIRTEENGGKVDLEQSDWTADDQFDFQYKVRGILSRLHGEYSELGKMALQRGAVGRMGAMFRKFVVPGFKRRWGKEAYIERLDDFVEGNYISTGRFFGKLFVDLVHAKFQAGAHWNEMTDHQKANVRRTLSEVSFLIVAIILSNLAIARLEDEDDEDDRMWSFMAYQALRLRAELLFFVKPDETMAILRSPMASMSFFENVIRLSGQIFHPAEVYERGPWKGQRKIYKTMVNMTPGFRQYYRLRDQQDQLAWFSSKIN